MRYRYWIAALWLAAACAGPARAGGADFPGQAELALDPRILMQGVVRDEDVSLLFAHLRSALIASYQGREMPSTEELDRRMEAIGAEMKARGTIAGLALLTVFEAAARQALRDAFPSPAPR